jgi:hypothetical protein
MVVSIANVLANKLLIFQRGGIFATPRDLNIMRTVQHFCGDFKALRQRMLAQSS